MNNVYNIDFLKAMLQALPITNRKPRFEGFIRIIASQIQKIHYEFLDFKNNLDQARKTQSCYLRAELNKWFDPTKRRIIVRTITPNYDDYLIHAEASEKFTLLSEETPFRLQKENNLLANHTSFEVVLPIGFDLSVSQRKHMESIIDKNKLPSKTYIITNG